MYECQSEPKTKSNQTFAFSKLPKPVNSSIITSYFEKDMNIIDLLGKQTSCSYCNRPFTEELWFPSHRFEDIKQIGEGGFAKVYFATWIDGKAKYTKHDNGSWKKSEPEPMEVVLKRLNGSKNMPAEYLNEV
ncbi:hypothetical protein C1645_828457 [Glomus cerebriforme]|uniref:Protein kinase domain-containing protein n=1 Tax=Glomus cerebriforme TaxID=658196 RepID=A0A397SQS8_9GLOM|nr:hypothetical protein C1645_828457 [Glomus cerebriforme]